MAAATLQSAFEALRAAGLTLTLTQDKSGIAVQPASRLTPELRQIIRDCRTELIGWLDAANDPAKPWQADWGPGTEPPADVQARLRAKSLASDAEQAGASAADPDRACWPYTAAWTESEIGHYARRLLSFAGRGVEMSTAEALADRLVGRDRDADDRHLCLECTGMQQGRCTHWRATGLGQPGIPAGMATTLQRCEVFRGS